MKIHHASSPAIAGQAIRPLKTNYFRMKNLFVVLFLTLALSGFSQFDFEADSNKVALFPERVGRIAVLNKKYDF